jgi:hypothetical protein
MRADGLPRRVDGTIEVKSRSKRCSAACGLNFYEEKMPEPTPRVADGTKCCRKVLATGGQRYHWAGRGQRDGLA